jgi:hypothetical protein
MDSDLGKKRKTIVTWGVIILTAFIVLAKPWIVEATGINTMTITARLEWALGLFVVVASLVFYLRSKTKIKSNS